MGRWVQVVLINSISSVCVSGAPLNENPSLSVINSILFWDEIHSVSGQETLLPQCLINNLLPSHTLSPFLSLSLSAPIHPLTNRGFFIFFSHCVFLAPVFFSSPLACQTFHAGLHLKNNSNNVREESGKKNKSAVHRLEEITGNFIIHLLQCVAAELRFQMPTVRPIRTHLDS